MVSFKELAHTTGKKGLQSPKSVGLFGSLQIQVRAGAAARVQIPQGSRLETHPEFLCCSLEAQFLLLLETTVFALKAFS